MFEHVNRSTERAELVEQLKEKLTREIKTEMEERWKSLREVDYSEYEPFEKKEDVILMTLMYALESIVNRPDFMMVVYDEGKEYINYEVGIDYIEAMISVWNIVRVLEGEFVKGLADDPLYFPQLPFVMSDSEFVSLVVDNFYFTDFMRKKAGRYI